MKVYGVNLTTFMSKKHKNVYYARKQAVHCPAFFNPDHPHTPLVTQILRSPFVARPVEEFPN